MADRMDFPATVEEFMEQYKIIDTEGVYTNGIELVPIFRMKQWFDRHPPADVAPMEILKAEIYKLKCQQDSKNQDYYTGYMSALSTVEGIIAEMGEE